MEEYNCLSKPVFSFLQLEALWLSGYPELREFNSLKIPKLGLNWNEFIPARDRIWKQYDTLLEDEGAEEDWMILNLNSVTMRTKFKGISLVTGDLLVADLDGFSHQILQLFTVANSKSKV